MAATDELANLSFEEALARLERIVKQLETGDAPLETAVDLYEEAQALRAHCEEKLSAAEARIAKLQLDSAGQPTGEADFPG